MALTTIADIAREIDVLSSKYRIGELQQIRRALKGHARLAGTTIFNAASIKDDYAFHYGGRQELQFNVGYETVNGETVFRHGVAFSLEPSQSLPDISVLFPKAARFNEFIRVYVDDLQDYRMWHWHKHVRSSVYPVSPIPAERLVNRTFIFVGRRYDPTEIDSEQILRDFDRLLPLYEFTESTNGTFPVVTANAAGLRFIAGNRPRKASTVAALSARTVDVALRHNQLQHKLHELLVGEHGTENVSSECVTGAGTRVDTAVRNGSEYWYFEIKTGLSARSCIRQGLPQLLEYSFWPGADRASRLVIVGEPPLDADAKAYMDTLTSEFELPIEYFQLQLDPDNSLE
jgi:hypothetical protein